MITDHIETKTILYYVQEKYKGKWVNTSSKYDNLEGVKLTLAEIKNRYPKVELRTVEETTITTTKIKVIDT